MDEEASKSNAKRDDGDGQLDSKKEEKSDWLGPAKNKEKNDEGSGESNPAPRDASHDTPKEGQSLSAQAKKEAKDANMRTLEGLERDTVDKGMAAFVDEAAERMMAELQSEPLYHGALPLEDIGGLLNDKGDFLIRELEPEPGRAAMPCLTVRLLNQLRDYPIHSVQVGESKSFTIDGVNKAKSVTGIVQKHYEQKIALPDEAILVKPIPKQPWELTKDKITLETKLGEGAFGQVWRGTLRMSSTNLIPAAIKVTKLKEENKSYMQELYKEARLMRQYKHLNVVAFFGMVMENDNVMIVMEMVNGGGLDHYLKKNQVGVPDKCSYAFDVALGLYYLHSKRCMHRDLACRNCLIDTQKNMVKISDFGLSKQADSYKIQPHEKIPTKWQAPEVVMTHVYTRESDVYSYGILVWEIFNNAKMPFEEYDNKTVRARISDPKFRPPLADDLPDEIKVICTSCWAATPENRPVMKDVAWILKKFQKHSGAEQVIKVQTPPNAAANPTSPPPAKQPSTPPVAQAAAPVLIAKSSRPVQRKMQSKQCAVQPQKPSTPRRGEGKKGVGQGRKGDLETAVGKRRQAEQEVAGRRRR